VPRRTPVLSDRTRVRDATGGGARRITTSCSHNLRGEQAHKGRQRSFLESVARQRGFRSSVMSATAPDATIDDMRVIQLVSFTLRG
jgi:hypothetical protein